MKLISFVVAATALLSSVYGQSQSVERSTQVDTVVEVADQSGCPLKLTAKLIGGRLPVIDIAPHTLSDKPIIGYILVQNGETSKAVFGIARPGDPVVKDTRNRNYGMGAALEEKHIVVSVDYVEFLDGTSWGEDAFKHGAGIKQFVRAWSLAMTRLRDITMEYKEPEFFVRRGTLGGTATWSGHVAPNGMPPPVPRGLEDGGYDSVLRNLRLRTDREAEAQEIARKLELMRTPYPTDK
jgi:hypothetical protein